MLGGGGKSAWYTLFPHAFNRPDIPRLPYNSVKLRFTMTSTSLYIIIEIVIRPRILWDFCEVPWSFETFTKCLGKPFHNLVSAE